MSKPIIGIMAHPQNTLRGTFDSVRMSYVRTVHRFGGIPILFPPIPDPRLAPDNLDLVSGVLVPGGADVGPELYGADSRPDVEYIEPELDIIEMAMIREAWLRDLPILAICRGIQSLAVALGGTLYQDLPSDKPGLRHEVRENGRDYLAHTMRIEARSELARILGRTAIQVNSLHHQAIRHLPPELNAVGWAEDDVIEAVESPSKRFVQAVQCHPEELCRLRARFWQAVRVVCSGL